MFTQLFLGALLVLCFGHWSHGKEKEEKGRVYFQAEIGFIFQIPG